MTARVDPPTTPTAIEGEVPSTGLWQSRETVFIGSESPRVVANAPGPRTQPKPSPAANDNGTTTDYEQEMHLRWRDAARPITIRPANHGRRSLRALMHWEGVVERVEGEQFHARLTPFEGGAPDRARVEYTDFALDDLANKEDRALVHEGARFYWTIGRAKNQAGTNTNVSLLRFRRAAGMTAYRAKLADAEAAALRQKFEL